MFVVSLKQTKQIIFVYLQELVVLLNVFVFAATNTYIQIKLIVVVMRFVNFISFCRDEIHKN